MSRKIKHIFKTKEMILALIAVAIVIGFTIINPNFLRPGSLSGIMQSISIIGIIAIGIGILLIGGTIDLSVGQISLFGGVVVAMLIESGIPWGFAIVLTLVISAAVGAINALLITKLSMMPFIATIAVSNVLMGLILVLTNAQNIPVPVESFWWGSRMLWIFPFPFIIMVILLVIYGFVLNRTQFGRNIYLVGGNLNSARLAGVNPARVRTILYINSAVLASFSGIVVASRMQTAAPQTQADTQLNAIAAVILGGVAFTGGSGGMAGVFIGTAIFGFFNSGLASLALDAFWSLIASGGLLVIALTADYINERSRERLLKKKIRHVSSVKGG